MPTQLHQSRFETVIRHLQESGARTVLDLGCGPGEFIQQLAEIQQFETIMGIDIDPKAIARARQQLGVNIHQPDGRIRVRCGSFEQAEPEFRHFDAAVLLETIEHIKPARLSLVERALFEQTRPRTVLITTPNQEYNVLHGMEPGERRHPGHQFEWDRKKFRHWASGIASRHHYRVCFVDIGTVDRLRGSSTQMACLDRGK